MLRLRLASALVLIPVALAAVYYGGIAMTALVLVFAMAMSFEWHRMIGERPFDAVHLVKSAVLAAVVLATGFDFEREALLLLAASAPLAFLASRIWGRPARWSALGMIYIGLPCAALLWLRVHHQDGLAMLIWVLATVWLADTGAYFAGRSIGGPKLAPRLSPNKTWAGLIGGIATAAAGGAAAAWYTGYVAPMLAFAASAMLALVAEMGDLAESAAKRHFGVKDTGTLIPGHGGALDRLDSMLFAAPAAVLILSLAQGGEVWR